MTGKFMLRLKVMTTLVFSLLLLVSGCASQADYQYGAATISTSPAGAEVVNLKDDSHLGITPVLISFTGEADTAEFVTIQFRKTGYIERIATFWVNMRHKTVEEAGDNAIDIVINLEKQPHN